MTMTAPATAWLADDPLRGGSYSCRQYKELDGMLGAA